MNGRQGGESHGFAKVFDGDVTTYFDCFGGVDDIKSDCWVGLELAKPSAVGTIRYYPRGSCPGCQTGGNPACGTSADKGGCRMSGGKFQGAQAAAGPWTDLAMISTSVPVAEGRWTAVSSQSSHTFSHVRYMSAPLGYCNVAEVVSVLALCWCCVLSSRALPWLTLPVIVCRVLKCVLCWARRGLGGGG